MLECKRGAYISSGPAEAPPASVCRHVDAHTNTPRRKSQPTMDMLRVCRQDEGKRKKLDEDDFTSTEPINLQVQLHNINGAAFPPFLS